MVGSSSTAAQHSHLPDFSDRKSSGELLDSPTSLKGSTKQCHFRATERGRGDVLPTSMASMSPPLPRSRSVSSSGYATDSQWNTQAARSRLDPLDTIKAMTQRLRSRRRTSSTDPYMNDNSGDQSVHMLSDTSGHNHASNRRPGRGSFNSLSNGSVNTWDLNNKNHRNKSPSSSFYFAPAVSLATKLRYMRKRDYLQWIVIAVVLFLVGDSYQKAVSTTERLEHFQQEESMMLLHLQRIEQQSINLHENLARLTEMSSKMSDTNANGLSSSSATNSEPGQQPQQLQQQQTAAAADSSDLNSNLIRVQTQQLYQMEEELDHELRALQAKLQNVARSSIIRNYGEGPVQVVLELDFPDDMGTASLHILLWYDTPHAAWTWLQQIQKGEWNGGIFALGQSSVDAAPAISNAGTLDFTEKSAKKHEAWTVGLTERDGSLHMFINMQNNAELHKRDVCVGKIIDGFDSLQRLVDATKRGDRQRSVLIKRATATHLTRNQRPP
jgi:hypothetical protein